MGAITTLKGLSKLAEQEGITQFGCISLLLRSPAGTCNRQQGAGNRENRSEGQLALAYLALAFQKQTRDIRYSEAKP